MRSSSGWWGWPWALVVHLGGLAFVQPDPCGREQSPTGTLLAFVHISSLFPWLPTSRYSQCLYQCL